MGLTKTIQNLKEENLKTLLKSTKVDINQQEDTMSLDRKTQDHEYINAI